MNILRWARRHGAPWDWTTCMYAVSNGQLSTLQWAFEHGAPWSDASIKKYEQRIVTKCQNIAVSLLRLHRGTRLTNRVARKFIRTIYSIIPLTIPLCDLIINY